MTTGILDATATSGEYAALQAIDLMIDVETLGTKPNSAILSFAFVQMDFKNNKLGHFLEVAPININSCQRVGMKVDGASIDWWFSQTKENQLSLKRAKDGHQVLIKEAAQAAGEWIVTRFGDKPVRVWGDSARFDVGLMANMFASCGFKMPWDFKNEMCYSTLKTMHPATPTEFRTGRADSEPLGTAAWQATHLLKLNKKHELALDWRP